MGNQTIDVMLQCNSPGITPGKESLLQGADKRKLDHQTNGKEDDNLPTRKKTCLSPDTTIDNDNDDDESTDAREEIHSQPEPIIIDVEAEPNFEALIAKKKEKQRQKEIEELEKKKMEKEKKSDKTNEHQGTSNEAQYVEPKFEDLVANKLEKQKQKDLEKVEKEKKKEEERLNKQKQRENEALEKKRKKEEEKVERDRKKEAEKVERERKKEEERLERERKKEEERIERERKKEEERIERERKKEEERTERERKKEEERLEREHKKEEEKLERERKKEEERLRKEEEKRKIEEAKEKGQKKISSFFSLNQRKSPTKGSLASDELQAKPLETAYDKVFLPFYQKKNTIVINPYKCSTEELQQSKTKFDSFLTSEPVEGDNFFTSINPKLDTKSKSISPDIIVNSLNSSDTTESQVYEMFQSIPPIKYLQFYENNKPPYIGTWCSTDHRQIHIPISDPFNTELTGNDYNYDSDLDWNGEEEEEGEDIDDDDDDEEEEDSNDAEDDEMDDFVEGDSKKKKRFIGPLVPIYQWNDGTNDEFFNEMKYERLHINIGFSIDPDYNYLGDNKSKSNQNNEGNTINKPTFDSYGSDSNASTNTVTTPNILTPQKPTIKDQKSVFELIKFIEENNGFTTGTLVELAQKKFTSYSKALLKHTIQDIAVYDKKTTHWEVNQHLKGKLAELFT